MLWWRSEDAYCSVRTLRCWMNGGWSSSGILFWTDLVLISWVSSLDTVVVVNLLFAFSSSWVQYVSYFWIPAYLKRFSLLDFRWESLESLWLSVEMFLDGHCSDSVMWTWLMPRKRVSKYLGCYEVIYLPTGFSTIASEATPRHKHVTDVAINLFVGLFKNSIVVVLGTRKWMCGG